jgi:O-antigen ligase
MIKGLEGLYVIFVLVFMSSAFNGLSTTPIVAGERSAGTVGQLALQIFVYLPAGILILRHRRSFVRGLADCKWAIALIGLALASGLWAADPLFVFRKSLILAATTAFGIYLGTRYRRDEQVAILCYALSSIGAMSLMMVVFLPQYGIDHFAHSGDWCGVFAQKNLLGEMMLLGALAFCLSSRKWMKSEALRYLGIVGFGALIALSRCVTAVVVGAVLLMLTLMYSFLRSRRTVLFQLMPIALLVLMVIVTVVAEYRGEFLGFLGRDETLTGRVSLWAEVSAAISRKPLLGYGFMSFWNGRVGPSASVVDGLVGWVP